MSDDRENKSIETRLRDLEFSNVRLLSHLESETGTYKRYTENLEAAIKRIEEMLKKYNDAIYGNGNAGILTHIDRLNQIEKDRRWNLRLIWSSLVGVVVKIIYDTLEARYGR